METRNSREHFRVALRLRSGQSASGGEEERSRIPGRGRGLTFRFERPDNGGPEGRRRRKSLPVLRLDASVGAVSGPSRRRLRYPSTVNPAGQPYLSSMTCLPVLSGRQFLPLCHTVPCRRSSSNTSVLSLLQCAVGSGDLATKSSLIPLVTIPLSLIRTVVNVRATVPARPVAVVL